MKHHMFMSKAARIALAIGIAAVVAPTAYASGGAVGHTYAPPPLDAGSAAPNPDYTRRGVIVHTYAPPPLDAGSAVPNPDYAFDVRRGPTRPDDRGTRATLHGNQQPVTVGERSTNNGFDWGDAGVGAAGVFAVMILAAGYAIGAGIGARRSRKRLASA